METRSKVRRAALLEKAIRMYETGATESNVSQATDVTHDEAKAVADALFVGETDRPAARDGTRRRVGEAAWALRGRRGLMGDGAEDVGREIWNTYP